jgi:Flp pilus assembly protein TadD
MFFLRTSWARNVYFTYMEWCAPNKKANRKLAHAQTLKGWVEFVDLEPTNPEFRARLAALLIRAGQIEEAEVHLDACLALCPPTSRKRLNLVVLRERVRAAGKRRKMLRREGLLL